MSIPKTEQPTLCHAAVKHYLNYRQRSSHPFWKEQQLKLEDLNTLFVPESAPGQPETNQSSSKAKQETT